MIDRQGLVERLNNLCWAARRYGHDDYGLEYAVDIDGTPVEDDESDLGYYHIEAVTLANELIKEWNEDANCT